MGLFLRRGGVDALRAAASAGLMAVVLGVAGCASPGPPKAPSLNLPAPVTDLVVSRAGDEVTLRFTAPSRTTDKLMIRGGSVMGEFCREVDQGECVGVPSSRAAVATADARGARNAVTWTDRLPASLTAGGPRLLGYRVEFFSASGRSAGWSATAWTAAGEAPAKVEDLRVEGTRLGAELSWRATQAAGEVLIRREDLAKADGGKPTAAAKPRAAGKRSGMVGASSAGGEKAGVLWMATLDGARQPDRVMDTTAALGTTYAYSASRRVVVALDARQIEVRSELTPSVEFTLRAIYPPAVPTGLTAAGYFAGGATTQGPPTKFAVDLIWNPVDEAGVMVPLAGYNVYRHAVNAAGEAQGGGVKLNTAPVGVPSFHDATARPDVGYRYSVTAVDTRGNESAAATVWLRPNP